VLVLGLLPLGSVHAFTVAISKLNSGAELYLRVGDGAFGAKTYSAGGTPQTGGAVNTVAVSVPAGVLGNGADQAMTSTSRLTSDYDGYAFCSSGQTYVGGFFRGTTGAGSATLTAVVSRPLSNGSNTIPFSQIGWTASGNGDGTATQPIPANTFGDVSKVLTSFPVNLWSESCHGFYYGNDAVVAAGTYAGTITYTLASP